MTTELPFRAEYSSSSRAGCKLCKEKIMKDDLRMATMSKSPFFDGLMPNWYHFRCFWQKFKIKTVADISHYESLRFEDQKKIEEKIASGGGAAGPSTSGTKGKKRKIDAGATQTKEFNVEYSKSSKANCRGCKEKIEKDIMRISKMEYETEAAKRFGPCPGWYHWECFIQARLALEYYEAADKLPGFKALADDDKKKLKEALKKIAEPKKEEDEVDGKKPKIETEEERKLKEQNKLIFKYRDWLEKNLEKKDWSELLKENGQEVAKGNSKILDSLSDIMTFGVLNPCPECKNGQLVFSNDGYHCVGDTTDWVKCTYITQNPKRSPFVVPEEYKVDHKFMNDYKFKKRDRIFANHGLPSVKQQQTTTVRPKKVLDYASIVIGGTKLEKSKEEIKKIVLDLGGKIVSQIDKTVACVIATQADVTKKLKKIQDAEDCDVHVVSEDFLDEVKKGDAAAAIIKCSIATWGSAPSGRLGASVQAMKSGSKSGASGYLMNKSSKSMKQKLTVKGGVAVEPESKMDHRTHVLLDGKSPYNAILNKVDLVSNSNSYYKLQILESDSNNQWWVFRAWGRTGTAIGGTKLEEMDSKMHAVKQFKALYLDKTGNDWTDRDNFQKRPNLFYPLDVDYGQHENFTKLAPGKNSKLHQSIQELICLIFDVDKMKKALVEFEVDLEKMPLGKLSKSHIEKAYKVLSELQKIIQGGKNKAKLLDASTRFYTLIPHSFGLEAPPLLDTEEIIKTKMEMVESMLEIQVAYSLLKEESSDKSKDPVDQHYEQLKTKMEVLDKKTDEFENIQKYIKNTHASTHNTYDLDIQEVFKIERQGENKRFKPFKKLPNRQLLWHGSRTTNYAGILSNGLKIAPPEAPVTGYMFGKGIYFADMVSKSANYCYTNKNNPTGLLMLCDVALGNMYELTQAKNIEKLPANHHSTKGLGRTAPDPTQMIETKDGVKIPLGTGKDSTSKQTSLLYNEYIVYDVAQVNIKYLIKVDFKWKY